jgi:hypothetical protein
MYLYVSLFHYVADWKLMCFGDVIRFLFYFFIKEDVMMHAPYFKQILLNHFSTLPSPLTLTYSRNINRLFVS